jgi:hypothetical protein
VLPAAPRRQAPGQRRQRQEHPRTLRRIPEVPRPEQRHQGAIVGLVLGGREGADLSMFEPRIEGAAEAPGEVPQA